MLPSGPPEDIQHTGEKSFKDTNHMMGPLRLKSSVHHIVSGQNPNSQNILKAPYDLGPQSPAAFLDSLLLQGLPYSIYSLGPPGSSHAC